MAEQILSKNLRSEYERIDMEKEEINDRANEYFRIKKIPKRRRNSEEKEHMELCISDLCIYESLGEIETLDELQAEILKFNERRIKFLELTDNIILDDLKDSIYDYAFDERKLLHWTISGN